MSSPTADEVAGWIDDVADVYDSGRAHWIRGRITDSRGGVCLVGAINVSIYDSVQFGNQPGRAGRWRLVNRVIHRAIRRRGDFPAPLDIPDWNDDYAKDQQEVVDLVREAAKLVRTGDLEVPE